jgi:hypothetical protein
LRCAASTRVHAGGAGKIADIRLPLAVVPDHVVRRVR